MSFPKQPNEMTAALPTVLLLGQAFVHGLPGCPEAKLLWASSHQLLDGKFFCERRNRPPNRKMNEDERLLCHRLMKQRLPATLGCEKNHWGGGQSWTAESSCCSVANFQSVCKSCETELSPYELVDTCRYEYWPVASCSLLFFFVVCCSFVIISCLLLLYCHCIAILGVAIFALV